MKILVTGATGFLGFHIAKDLKAEGHEVINFSRSHTTELDSIQVKSRLGDLTNLESVQSAMHEIDAIFHVASKVGMWGKWDDFYKANYLGTKNLVDTAIKSGIKTFIYTSTPSVVFGNKAIENGDESIPYPDKYLSLYAKSKALGEQYVLSKQSINFNVTSIRPHLIYGKRDKNIIPRLIQAQKKGNLKIIGSGNNLVDIIHVENASDAHLLAFKELLTDKKNAGKAYFIGQESPVKLWVFINNILEINKLPPVTKSITVEKAYFIGMIVEFFLRLFRIYNVHPPMTRFVALQLGTSHYFGHENARNDFSFHPKISIKESLNII